VQTLEKETIPLGVRSVSKRGGSFQVTIPPEVVRIMQMAPEDLITFSYDRESEKIVIGRVSKRDLERTTSLRFSISKELAKELLKEDRDHG
jgi:antitoxin component of MazEF toxin-antitoxin module